MWPFKSNIPTLEQITTENDGNTITVVLSKGAHKFSKEEVLDLRLTSDVFSPRIKNYPPKNFFFSFFIPLAESATIKVITFILFGGFLNLFILYFYSLYLFEIMGDIYLRALPLSLICTICVYLIFYYLLKCFQVAKRKDHPELDLYFEDIVTISLNNCVIQFRMDKYFLALFYDPRSLSSSLNTKSTTMTNHFPFGGIRFDETTFGFLINYSKKRSLEKESNSTFWSVEGFDFFAKNGGYFYVRYILMLIGLTALYFFWGTPFWHYSFFEHIFTPSESTLKIQFLDYYRSDDISFLRAFFDGMVSNLISISMILGFIAFVTISFVFIFMGILCILFEIFFYMYLNSKLHRFLSNSKNFTAKLSIVIIISLLLALALLSIYLGILYCEAIKENHGLLYLTHLFLPGFTWLVLNFFYQKTTFSKKSAAGLDQFFKIFKMK